MAALRMVSLVVGGLVGLAGLAAVGWYAFIRSVETPRYTVVTREGAFELRKYKKWVVAEVDRRGSRQRAVSSGFGPLAGYIFAKERTGKKIAMTAPVLQEVLPEGSGRADSRSWRVRFIMPSQYDLDALPAPARDGVRLAEIEARTLAAVRFSGVATDADFKAQEEKLRAWMATQDVTPTGAPILAYYDDPSIPGPLRHNEVLIAAIEEP